MRRFYSTIFILGLLLAGMQNAAACWFDPPPPPCQYCGGSAHNIELVQCPACGTTYASCTSHKCDNGECPGCGAKGVIHGFRANHCCGEMSKIYVCQPVIKKACACGAPYAVPSHARATCPYCGQKYHVCQGHECPENQTTIPPDLNPPDTPYVPPQPGDPDYPYPVAPGDPPFFNPDPPVVILPPSDPGDPPVVVQPPPGTDLPVNPGDPPVIIPPGGPGDPPVVILPPSDPGDPPVVIQPPPEIGPETPDPENEDVIIQRMVYRSERTSVFNQVETTTYYTVETEVRRTVGGEFISETVISTDMEYWRKCLICGKEGAWEYPVCPDADLTCPDCGQNIHGVKDHECPGAPEDPTQADPGHDPEEEGEPDETPVPGPGQPARFFVSRINQQAILKPVGTVYQVDIPASIYVAPTSGTAPGDKTIYLHCIPDDDDPVGDYEPATTSVQIGHFTPPAPPLMLFGRGLYPNLRPTKGAQENWSPSDEFLLIVSEKPDTADALQEAVEDCGKQGCRYHLRVRFNQTQKPAK